MSQPNQPFDKGRYLKRDSSRSALRVFTFSDKMAGTIYPDANLQNVLALIDSDPVARGAYTAYIDAFMEGDYAVIKKDDFSHDLSFEQKLDDEYNFRQEVIRGYATVGKFSKNVFLEVVRKTDGSIKALNVLDSTLIDVRTKTNGDVLEYISKIPDPLTGKYPTWGADEIVWYKLEDRKTGFSTVDLKVLFETLQAKSWVKRYAAWLFKTGQYRLMYNFKNASDKDVEDFLTYARRHAENFDAPFIAKGELEAKVLRDMKETSDLTVMLKYYDSEILVAMRVPPIDAGIPDASGRSNADAQDNSLSAHLTSMKKVFEDTTNFKLFPLMNKGNNMIRFGPNNRFEEKQIWDNVKSLRSVMMSEEVIREYLQDRGIFLRAKKLFDDPPQTQAAGGPQKQSDGAPSRQASVDGNKQGTGEAASTRADQMKQ